MRRKMNKTCKLDKFSVRKNQNLYPSESISVNFSQEGNFSGEEAFESEWALGLIPNSQTATADSVLSGC